MDHSTSDKVNAMSTSSSRLISLLEEYIDKFNEDSLDDRFKKLVHTALADESDPTVFSEIAANVWDKYSCVDVELVISILRRWSAIEPDSGSGDVVLRQLVCGGLSFHCGTQATKSLLEGRQAVTRRSAVDPSISSTKLVSVSSAVLCSSISSSKHSMGHPTGIFLNHNVNRQGSALLPHPPSRTLYSTAKL